MRQERAGQVEEDWQVGQPHGPSYLLLSTFTRMSEIMKIYLFFLAQIFSQQFAKFF